MKDFRCLILPLLMLCLFGRPGHLHSQNQALLDSLEREVVHAQSDSARVYHLISLSVQYVRQGMPQAKNALQNALNLTENYQPEKWPSQKLFLQYQGRVYFLNGNYHKRSGNFTEALRFYHLALQSAEQLANDRARGDALIGISTVYGGYLKEFDNAIRYLSMAEEAFKKANYTEGLMMVYGNLGAIYSNLQRPREGLEQVLKAEKIVREKNLEGFKGQIYSDIASMYVQLDSIPQALEYAEKARIAFQNNKDLMRYCDHLLLMSDLCKQINDYAGAEKYALEAIDAAQQGQHTFILKDAYSTLQNIYLLRASKADASLKDSFFLRAFYFNELQRVVSDSLFSSEKSRQIAELSVQFETEKKEREISQLSAEAKDRQIDLLRKEAALRQEKRNAERARERFLLLEQTNANIALQLEVKEAKIQGQNTEAREKQREIEALNADNKRREIEAKSEKTLRYSLLAGLLGLAFFTFLLFRLYLQKNEANKKIEQQRSEIAAQNQQLADANRFKSIFLSNMSHEIRTPLNTIIGMSELLAAAPLPDKERQHAQIVRLASNNLLTLINEVLDFSKIEAGKIDFQPRPFDLRELLERQISLVQLPAEQKNIRLLLHCSPDLPHGINADPGRLGQILLNLLSNAVKFTQQGEVELSANVQERRSPSEFLLRLAVRDTGIGIAPNDLPLIFDAFKQAGQNTHLEYSGTGLGLAISKQLVELQGGTMSAQSSPGKGSTFEVLLPVQIAALEEVAPQPAQQQLPPCHILLVEDNAFNQQLACELLRQLIREPEIEIAQNGLEALEKAEKGAFDMIFMDIKMPRMDGFAATKALRENGVRIPIIALTANATAEERDKCLQAGMDDYLSKPIEVALLRGALVKWRAHLPA